MDKRTFIPIFKNDDGDGSPIWYTATYLDNTYGLDTLSVVGKKLPKEQYTEILRKQVPDNFCLYPFTHFQLDPDGRARPCCKYKVGDPTWQTDVPKLPDVNIGELWDQAEFQNLREQFLRNERPSGCKACWD